MSLNKLVNPYLPQYIFSDYIEYLDLPILKLIYNNIELDTYNKIVFTYNIIENIKPVELNEIDKNIIYNYIIEYNNELNRIEYIRSIYNINYKYNKTRKYKTDHLSHNIKSRKNITTCCDIKEFIDKNKNIIKYSKDINKKDLSIIFLLSIIEDLFENYIKSLNYSLSILRDKPYICIKNYNNVLTYIDTNYFKVDNDNNIYIKHINNIKNIKSTENGVENSKDYIKLYYTKNKSRINMYFI
jgi:hypothetical protein